MMILYWSLLIETNHEQKFVPETHYINTSLLSLCDIKTKTVFQKCQTALMLLLVHPVLL